MTYPIYKIEMNRDHSCRYTALTNALTERQCSDRSYLAACYLLSADDEVFNIAKQYVSIDGIDFAAIRMRVKKRFGTYNEYTAVEVGYSLFTWRDCKVNPHEMAQSGPFWLPIICNALLLQGNAADVEV
nr:hypothetical protein [uncultured Gemmiger sp.]